MLWYWRRTYQENEEQSETCSVGKLSGIALKENFDLVPCAPFTSHGSNLLGCKGKVRAALRVIMTKKWLISFYYQES